jgi:hypothetical protein
MMHTKGSRLNELEDNLVTSTTTSRNAAPPFVFENSLAKIPSNLFRLPGYCVATTTKPKRPVPRPKFRTRQTSLPKGFEEKVEQLRKTTQRLRGERGTTNGALAGATKARDEAVGNIDHPEADNRTLVTEPTNLRSVVRGQLNSINDCSRQFHRMDHQVHKVSEMVKIM